MTFAVSDLFRAPHDAGNPHVRFDERGWETERCRMAQATALILDSTTGSFAAAHKTPPGIGATGGSRNHFTLPALSMKIT